MELVANVWPIVDQMTGVVQRFLFRAYALNATDQEMSYAEETVEINLVN